MTADAELFDPRTVLARPDLAELALEGLVRADAYRAPEVMHGRAPVADIFDGPGAGATRIDQLLHGEIFDVLDRAGDRVWGRARRDGVVGWMGAPDLAAGSRDVERRVISTGGEWPLNALVAAGESVAAETVPVGDFENDPVAVAERLLGVAHALGARSTVATDCAGLVQQALYACGRAGPRYADQQAELGRGVSRAEAARGDLAVWLHGTGGAGWTGHSGFMLDSERVLHASGDRGGVVIEPFADVDARCRADGFDAPVFRRV
ncbi:MAG: NlpC/P60 family protein [Pseudomonadota bacterium]